MKTQLLTIIALGVLSFSTAQAVVSGQSSDPTKIQVGGTEWVEGHDGEPGSPGIGYYNSEKAPFKRVSLNRLEWLTRFGFGGSYDYTNDVTKVREDGFGMPESHQDFGFYAFKKVRAGGANVYFGEWSQEDDFTDDSHIVYYVGKDKTTSMPNSGTATYAVQGINNFVDNGLLNGVLNANFATNTLAGSFSNSSLTVGIDSTINPATASFAGSATATGAIVAGGTASGDSTGEFFGNNAAALGGITEFDDNTLDTAFAGKR